jgi:hypothetical protein
MIKKKDAIEGNNLIAKYMRRKPPVIELGTDDQVIPDRLEYHCNWEELMPVVLKIQKKHEVRIKFKNKNGLEPRRPNVTCEISSEEIFTHYAGFKPIEVVWCAVLDYVIRYKDIK